MKRVSTAIMLIGIAMLIWALGNDVSVEGMRGSRVTLPRFHVHQVMQPTGCAPL